jgi:hypothetical protein
MVILIVLMGIIIKKYLQMYPIMGGGNVDMCHDCCMYIVPNCNIVVLMAILQQF